MQVFMMRWSPDDSKLAFVGKTVGAPWKLYTVSADGSQPEPVLDDPRNAADPDWSPDGSRIVFGRLPEYFGEVAVPKEIHVVDLKTRAVSTLPDSKGMFCPRWSPDGRYIAAMPLNQRRLMLFDFTTNKWTQISDRTVNNPRWSRDGRSIYFQAFQEADQPVYRLSIKDAKLERITDVRMVGSADYADFWGLGQDDAPIASLRFWTADVYSLDWDASRYRSR
jgi:Tol biopolymer transport system component